MNRVRRNHSKRSKAVQVARSAAGLGLLEVLVAIAIFAFGIVAVMQLFPASLRELQMANQRTVSTELAESNLSQIRVATAASLLNTQFLNPGAAINAIYKIYDEYTDDANQLGSITTVSPLRGGDSTYLQRVTFTVQMPDGRQEVYVTYVSKQ